MDVGVGLFPDVMATNAWTHDNSFSCSEKSLQDWVVDPKCALSDSESDGILHGVDPNEVFPNAPVADQSSESDSGISVEPVVEGPIAMVTEEPIAARVTKQSSLGTVYQVVYDIGGDGARMEAGRENVVSIEFDQWSSQLLLSDSCVVSELPVVAATRSMGNLQSLGDELLLSDLQLTEEEKKLLSQEGVSLPNNLPLTKAEERILKKVRRKIRNKQSAQDSRKRRKEYIDGLENRAASCSAQNRELQRTVEQLEKHNTSLLAQLRQLQSLIKQTVSKGAQTSTCLLIILVSLALIVLPSFSPFRLSSVDDDYRPSGVISRNILTNPASSQQTTNEVDFLPAKSMLGSDFSQSEAQMNTAVVQEPMESPQSHLAIEASEGSQSDNSTTAVAGQINPVGKAGGHDPGKLTHADEM
ncbi:cyclic AMP-responsive element-binding protein 3-like protein 4 isoform X2 [Gouania willdenowi]|uniref:cyclic AMP-responsive element-binding protein 3-like protein 4 isoform X2 n=1 Tax=Gouania willdenowi TaxID=441366 RepID=UPI0010558A9B|nr:cyclic AMP-responsive element-binding protein 3-like protein 4 isoform X2 [Gouania willdenowi]